MSASATLSAALMALVVLAPAGTDAAPEAPPDTLPDEGTTAFERQLAEWGFGTFLAIEVGVDPGTFTCTEPPTLEAGETVTCFTLLDGGRVIVATTTVSGATGVFDFLVVADYIVDDPALETTQPPASTLPPETSPTVPSTAPLTPTTFPSADVTEANIAILLYGDSINAIAENEMASVINAADGAVIAVNAWVWDPTAASFTVDFTLNPELNMDLDVSAWVSATTQSVHWARGQPFREPAATIRPVLVVVVGGQRYVSGWDLMTQVSDQTITMDDWVAATRQV